MSKYVCKYLIYSRNLLGNNAMYVTILRHPADLFESMFNYFPKFEKELKMDLQTYIKRYI